MAGATGRAARAKARPAAGARAVLSGPLREAIEASGLSSARLAGLVGTTSTVISRFRSGRRDLYLGTADRVAEELGLRLTVPRRASRPSVPSSPASTEG